MENKVMRTSRRKFLKQVAAGATTATAAGIIPSRAFSANKMLTVGMNIPMTGDLAPWGLPGFYGCEIIVNNINAAGGVTIGGETYDINIATYDHAGDTAAAVQGMKKLTLEDDAKMVMMLGGAAVGAILPWATRKKVLSTTLLPSDITPDSNYLVATCESHPLYNVTGVEYLARNFPDAKTAVIVTNNDAEYGLQSTATYKAAFEVVGIEVVDINLHGFDVTDFAPIVSSVLAKNPDIFCMATSFYVTPIMEQLYHQGFEGKVISCTLDYYDEIIAKTSVDFVNGTIFQFPDFDDPALLEEGISFPDPAGFDAAFRKDHPNDWSAVSWEYPVKLLNWLENAKAAGSVDSVDVIAHMTGTAQDFVFGGGNWWGSQLWGLDNVLVGRWPVVVVQDGRARIQEYGDLAAWLDANNDTLIKHMKELGLRTV